MATKALVLDFESASLANLKLVGAYVYAEHPSTEVLCLSWALDGGPIATWEPSQPIPKEIAVAIADPKTIFVAHNAGFEKAIWREIMVGVFGWPALPSEKWHDTAATANNKGLPGKLDVLARVLHLTNQKWKEGNRVTMAMSRPDKTGSFGRTSDKLQIVYQYNREDVAAQREVHGLLGWQTRSERNLWLLDQKINDRGIRLDRDYVDAAQSIVNGYMEPAAAEFETITRGLKASQRDKVLQWVRDSGVPLANLQKATITQLIGDKYDDPDGETESLSGEVEGSGGAIEIPAHVRRALEIRQIIGSASIKKLGAMSRTIAEDGRVHGATQYYGAQSTGRWAGRLFQPQNFPRGELKIDGNPADIALVIAAIQTGDWKYVRDTLGDPITVVVAGLRHAILASSGNELVVGDYSTVEARLVLALAGQHDKTALMASGKDIYNDMATTIYKRPIDRKGPDKVEGQVGKNAVLGCGFQMGWKKFKMRYAPDMTDDEAKEVINAYRKEFAPKVPVLWTGLEDAAFETVYTGLAHESHGVLYEIAGPWLTARLPSGRKLHYFEPRKSRKAMPWDATDIREAWSYKAYKMGHIVTVDAYGGLLAENVVQALARDLLADALTKSEKEGLDPVLTVHDEIVCDTRSQIASADTLRQIMRDIPSWAKDIQAPIDAETWQGQRYRK